MFSMKEYIIIGCDNNGHAIFQEVKYNKWKLKRIMKKNKMAEEMVNNYADTIINHIKDQIKILENLINETEKIRTNVLNEINTPKSDYDKTLNV